MTTSRRDQRGASMVEAPLAIIVFAFLALGVVAFAQVLLNYQHLTGATRAAARYAAKNDYDPTRAVASASRRPSTAEVTTFAIADASPLPLSAVDITDAAGTPVENSTGTIGEPVHLQAQADVGDGPYQLVSGLVNGLGSLFGGAQVLPFPYRIHSEAVALYE